MLKNTFQSCQRKGADVKSASLPTTIAFVRKLFWLIVTVAIGGAVAMFIRRRVAERPVGTPDHWPNVPRKDAANS
jgi:hypothetical protein